jgi:hypothetical protein
MGARRLRLTMVASLCGLACALGGGVPSAVAGPPTQFGSTGTESGQFKGPFGVALDHATGDVYVSDLYNYRVDKFDGSGNFLTSWGWNVNEESAANELQTCTISCQVGSYGSGAGQFASEGPQGVAVDNDPLSASYGDVYVVDWEGFRVEKFDSSGKFLLMFGGAVNETSGGDICVAGEKCRSGEAGTGNGQLEWDYRANGIIAVGPDGAVYVGDKARVEVFESTGGWRENISLAGLSSTGNVTALTVDSAGDMFVVDQGVSGVRELEPSGAEKAQFDTSSSSVEAIAVDAKGDLFVADSTDGFHVVKYDPAGNELASFGSKAVSATKGMAFSDALDELYVSAESNVQILTPPPPGPNVESGSETATPGLRGVASLGAMVDPEGNETTYHFEYIDQAHFQANGYADASSTPSASVTSGFFEDHAATASLTGLVPGAIYHYRVVATNSQGMATGADQTFEASPPALVEGPWATDVAGTSATLAARIDPLGVSTEYRLEYGTSTSYGHVLSGNVSEGIGYVPVSFHQQELQPGTTYHYRVTTDSVVGAVEGQDHTFTTQPAGGQELTLPDGRAWELVSPPNKNGALIEFTGEIEEVEDRQAASDGSGIAYLAFGPHVGENPVGKSGVLSHVLSRRGPSGWASVDITLPRGTLKEGQSGEELLGGEGGVQYYLFSPTLSLAAVEPAPILTPLLSPEATERTLYLRNDVTETFQPLVTPKNVPSGTNFGGEEGGASINARLWMKFVAATPDLSHVVFESPYALTSNAISELNPVCEYKCGRRNLYEWSAGALQLINILPDGEATHDEATEPHLGGMGAGGLGGGMSGSVPRAMSNDGRRVVWTRGAPYQDGGYGGLYLRDMVQKTTVRIGGKHAVYQTMSSDGSRVFFLEHGNLYEFDTNTGAQIDLTASSDPGEASAGVKEAVSDVSEDGSYVYFVATGVLASGGISGEDNLYLAHYDGGSWSTRYVATLSGEDEKSWYDLTGYLGVLPLYRVDSRVSPNGRYLAFMSSRSLTGYDNTDANSGHADEEVYLYDATADRLSCASCDPTGARPVGVLDQSLVVDRISSWASAPDDHWLAGSVPGWDATSHKASYQPRYLSNSGRLFFNSSDALVPQDTNGLEDVYQYEPAGVGSCTTADVTFHESSGGCVDLISSGTSDEESAFYDASENGDDVFFITSNRLTAADYDTGYDVYDAHVCTTSTPCAVALVPPPPCTSGDSCKAAPSPQPEIFGPAPSATFSGAGNVVEEAKKSVVRRKPKPKPKSKRHAKRDERMRKKGKKAGRLSTVKASRKGQR